ncbi:unnamed protein product [Urochloa humidicola]
MQRGQAKLSTTGGKMLATDGRRRHSFPPMLFPLLLLVLHSGYPAPCKGQLSNSAAPAPVLAPSLGFETTGFDLSRAWETGSVHGRINPSNSAGGNPGRQPGSRRHPPKPHCNFPFC